MKNITCKRCALKIGWSRVTDDTENLIVEEDDDEALSNLPTIFDSFSLKSNSRRMLGVFSAMTPT